MPPDTPRGTARKLLEMYLAYKAEGAAPSVVTLARRRYEMAAAEVAQAELRAYLRGPEVRTHG